MGWNLDKCLWGTPSGFTDAAAAQAVQDAVFDAAVYVNISDKEKKTKQAYTYYIFGGYRICVVGHVHKDDKGDWTKPGNCFIPGWMGDDSKGWEMKTPASQVRMIGALGPRGAFPGDDRYPHKAT